MKRLYLYLASRSKKGIRVVTILQGNQTGPSPLTDVTTLKLPQLWERKIMQIIHDNRMDFEAWIESAADFEELKEKLKDRGYKNLPVGFTPLLNLPAYSKAPIACTKSCAPKKTMLRKVK